MKILFFVAIFVLALFAFKKKPELTPVMSMKPAQPAEIHALMKKSSVETLKKSEQEDLRQMIVSKNLKIQNEIEEKLARMEEEYK